MAAAVTAESLIEQKQKVFDAAYNAKQFSAAVGANKEISILAGIRIERSEIGSRFGVDPSTVQRVARPTVATAA